MADPDLSRQLKAASFTVITDVTESARSRHAGGPAKAPLGASEERLRSVLAAALVGTWEVDLATREILADPLVLTLFELPPRGLYELQDFLVRIAPADRDRLAGGIEAALRGGNDGVFEVVCRVRRAAADWRWLDGRGKVECDGAGQPRRLLGTVFDITARKEAELAREGRHAEVVRARQRLYAQFMQAPVAVSVVRGPDFVYELANPRYLEIMGRQDIVGKTFREAFPELPDETPVLAVLRGIRESGQPFSADEFCVLLDRTGSGVLEDVYFQFTCQPVRDDSGYISEIMTVAVDMTAQVKARRRIEALLSELRLSDQRKDEFLATLAHELRNPMAAISTALSLLERVEGDAAQSARFRGTARRQMGNLVRLVDDLLDVARINRAKIALRKEEFDLAAVVQQALTVARPLLEERGHQLTVHLIMGELWLEADATRLEQVVVNLLTNAAKYTEPGGRIAVQLQREEAAAPQAVLRVRDSGRGIPADMLDKVFDLFTQVSPTIDRSTGGLGLGLTLVKKLVEMHGGGVTAASDGPGSGSEFTVRLPLSPRPVQAARAGEAPAVAAAVSPRRRIVVVEDCEDVRETMKDLLEALGHEVVGAKDGLEGVERLLALRPDLALIDVGLPGIDGYEVARRVRAQPAGAALFLAALTGYGGPEVKARAEAAGFDLHLTKPLDAAGLLDVLSRCVKSP